MVEKETVIVDRPEPERREVVERSGPSGGLIALIVVVVLILLFLLFGGMNMFNGGGTPTNGTTPSPTTNTGQ